MSYFDAKISRIPVGSENFPETTCGPVELFHRTKAEWNELYARQKIGHDETLCYAELTDNGHNGDGVTISVFAGESTSPVFHLIIPDSSLPVLTAALQSIKMLRDSQLEP